MEETETVGNRIVRRDFKANRHAQAVIDEALTRLIGSIPIANHPRGSEQDDQHLQAIPKLQQVPA